MAAPVNASGTMRHWRNGLPYSAIKRTTIDTNGMKYWRTGTPLQAFWVPEVTTVNYINISWI